MSDVRLASAWVPTSWLRVGVGASRHLGHNLLHLTQSFADSAAVLRVHRSRACSGSAAARFRAASSSFRRSSSPPASARYGGIAAACRPRTRCCPRRACRIGSARRSPTSASPIRRSRSERRATAGRRSAALGSPGLHGVDAWDTSIGADIAGPHMGQRILFLRGGYRIRTLPFQAAGQDVSEKSITAGLGHGICRQPRVSPTLP